MFQDLQTYRNLSLKVFLSKFEDHLLCLLFNSNKRENAEWYCPWKKISISKAQRQILCRLGFSIADNTHRFQRGGHWSVAPTFFHFLGKVGWKNSESKLDIDKIYTGSKNLCRRRAIHACRGEAKGEHLADVLSAPGASQCRWTCAIHPKLPTNHQQKQSWPFDLKSGPLKVVWHQIWLWARLDNLKISNLLWWWRQCLRRGPKFGTWSQLGPGS